MTIDKIMNVTEGKEVSNWRKLSFTKAVIGWETVENSPSQESPAVSVFVSVSLEGRHDDFRVRRRSRSRDRRRSRSRSRDRRRSRSYSRDCMCKHVIVVYSHLFQVYRGG